MIIGKPLHKRSAVVNHRYLHLTILVAGFWSAPLLANPVPLSLQNVPYIHHPTLTHFTSGQPTEEQMAALATEGVQHLIDLRPADEADNARSAEWAGQYGLTYHHLPVTGADDLSYAQVKALDQILQAVGDDKALLHCASSNRVGAMIALHAVWFEGMEKQDAIIKGQDYGLTSLESAVNKALENRALEENSR